MWCALSMDKFIHLFIADSTITGKAPHSIRLLKGHSMKKSSFTQTLIISEQFIWSLDAIFKAGLEPNLKMFLVS